MTSKNGGDAKLKKYAESLAVTIDAKLTRVIHREYIYLFTYEDAKLRNDNINKEPTFVALGNVNPVSVGSIYKLEGIFEFNRKYGKHQLNISNCEMIGSLNRTGMINLLMEAPRVGKRTASSIVRHLGVDCLNVIAEDKELLVTTVGLPVLDAEKIHEWAKKEKRNSNFKRFLYSLNLTTFQVNKCIEKFDGLLKSELQKRWHELTEIDGVGFLTACKVADKLGIPAVDSNRVREGIKYAIEKLMANGNVCVDWKNVKLESAKLLCVKVDNIIKEMQWLVDNEKILKSDTRFDCTRVNEILQCKPFDPKKSSNVKIDYEDEHEIDKKIRSDDKKDGKYIRAKTYNVVAVGECKSCNRTCDLRFVYNPYGDDYLLCNDCGDIADNQLNEDVLSKG